MNRRSFLSGLAAIAAGAALDPERLLWRPKLISIPPPRRLRMRKGDKFTVAGYFHFNPETRRPTSNLQLFTATEDVFEGGPPVNCRPVGLEMCGSTFVNPGRGLPIDVLDA